MAKIIIIYLLLVTDITGQLFSQDTGNWIDKGRYYENKILIPAINYIKFTPDGKYFYTYGADSTLRKWDVNTGEVVREIKIDVENSKYIDVNYNETKYLVCTSKAYLSDTTHWSFDVYVFDMKTEKILLKFDGADKYENVTWGTTFLDNFARYHPSRDEIITTYGTEDFYGGYWNYKGRSILFDGKDGSVIRSIDKNGGYFAYSGNNSKIAFIRSEGNAASQSHGDYHDKTVSLVLTDDSLGNETSLGYGYYYEDPYTSRENGLGKLFLDLNGIAFSSDDAVVYSNCKVNNEQIYCFNTNDESIDSIKTMHDNTAVQLKGIEVTEDGRFIAGLVNIVRYNNEPGDKSALYYINTKTHEVTDSISFPEITGQNFICKSPDNKSLIFSTENDNKSRLIIVNPEFGSKTLHVDFRSDRRLCQTGDTVHFFDYSGGNPNSWEWDFGDGSKSNEQNPGHIYKKSGYYSVSLSIRNDKKDDLFKRKVYIQVLDPSSVKLQDYNKISDFYPNPVSEVGSIKYHIDSPSNVNITIYDSFGCHAAVYNAGYKPAGANETVINTSGLAQGVYFYTLKAGSEMLTGEFVVVK